MNREGSRGKRGKQGKGDGGGRADAPRKRAPRTRPEDVRRGGTRAAAARACSSAQSRLVAAARFSPPFTQEVLGGWVWNARTRVPRASQVWDGLTEHSCCCFSLDAIETRQFSSF